MGGSFEKRLTIKQLKKQAEKNWIHIDHSKIYGKPLEDPILGHYFNIPERTTKPKSIEFDTSFSYVSIISIMAHLLGKETFDTLGMSSLC